MSLPLPSVLLLLTACGGAHTADRRAVDVSPTVAVQTPVSTDPGASASVVPWPLRHRGFAGDGPRVDPQVAWKVALPGPVTAPLTTDRTSIFAVGGGTVTNISRKGQVLWQVQPDAVGPVTPSGNDLYVGVRDGALIGLSPSDGGDKLAFPGTARVRGSAVPVEGGLAWATVDGKLHHTLGDTRTIGPTVARDLASDGDFVFLSSLDGMLYGVPGPGRSEAAWRSRLPGPARTQPVVLGSVVIVGHDAGTDTQPGLFAASRTSGRVAWQRQLASPPASDLAVADLLPADDTAGMVVLIPRHDGVIEAFDPKTETTRWETALGPHPLVGSPVVAGRSAWVGDAGGSVHRVDLDDGGVAWSRDLGAAVTGDPLLIDGLLVVGLADGTVVALEDGT